MHRMTDEEFEAALAEALDAMPEQFLDALENVAVVWENEPNAYHLGWDDAHEDSEVPAGDGEGGELPDDLLGLFDGLSIVERANGYDDDIPDVITVFKGPTSAASPAARKSWRRSARPSSTSWATTSALTRTSWPPWATSKPSSASTVAFGRAQRSIRSDFLPAIRPPPWKSTRKCCATRRSRSMCRARPGAREKAPLRHSPRTTVQPRLPHVPMPGVGKDAYEEEFEHFADRRSAREAATKAPNRDRATESASSSAIMGNASADGP